MIHSILIIPQNIFLPYSNQRNNSAWLLFLNTRHSYLYQTSLKLSLETLRMQKRMQKLFPEKKTIDVGANAVSRLSLKTESFFLKQNSDSYYLDVGD